MTVWWLNRDFNLGKGKLRSRWRLMASTLSNSYPWKKCQLFQSPRSPCLPLLLLKSLPWPLMLSDFFHKWLNGKNSWKLAWEGSSSLVMPPTSWHRGWLVGRVQQRQQEVPGTTEPASEQSAHISLLASPSYLARCSNQLAQVSFPPVLLSLTLPGRILKCSSVCFPRSWGMLT